MENGASEKIWVDCPVALRVNLTSLSRWELTGWVVLLSRLLNLYRFQLLDFISSAAIPSAAWHKVQRSQPSTACRTCGMPTVVNWTEWRIESRRTSTPA